MTLGGLCLSGCCGCTILDDTFQRPDSSSLGGGWRTLAGSPCISSNALSMSAGDAVAWLGGFTTLMGSFQVVFASLSAGAIFRIYMGAPNTRSVPSSNYVEYTYHPYVSSDSSEPCTGPAAEPCSTYTASGTTSQTVTICESAANLFVDGSGGVTCSGSTIYGVRACIGQTGSAYHINGGEGVNRLAAQVDCVPAGSNVVLELLSGTATLSLAAAWDVGDITCPNVENSWGTTGCLPCMGCDSSCGCDGSQLSVTVSGVPSACVPLYGSSFDGAYTLICGSPEVGVGPVLWFANKCYFYNDTTYEHGVPPFISFSYNPVNDTSTVVGWLTDLSSVSLIYSKTVAGSITCADLAGMRLLYVRGQGATGCNASTLAVGSSILITAVT